MVDLFNDNIVFLCCICGSEWLVVYWWTGRCIIFWSTQLAKISDLVTIGVLYWVEYINHTIREPGLLVWEMTSNLFWLCNLISRFFSQYHSTKMDFIWYSHLFNICGNIQWVYLLKYSFLRFRITLVSLIYFWDRKQYFSTSSD